MREPRPPRESRSRTSTSAPTAASSFAATVRRACVRKVASRRWRQSTVRLPLVPDMLSGAIPAALPVSATHVATVDRFRGR